MPQTAHLEIPAEQLDEADVKFVKMQNQTTRVTYSVGDNSVSIDLPDVLMGRVVAQAFRRQQRINEDALTRTRLHIVESLDPDDEDVSEPVPVSA